MFNLGKIIGKKVKGIRGRKDRKNQANITATHILFDDEETFLELERQDYYFFHDCDSDARIINIYKNAGKWTDIANSNNYGDANIDI